MAERNDIGPIAIVIGADPENKIVMMQFTSSVNRLEFSPGGARNLARDLTSRAQIADGEAAQGELPITTMKPQGAV